MNRQNAREKISQKLAGVSEVTTGILRAVRRNGEQDFAAYVFDLNNHLPETTGGLHNYLDEVIGRTYFDKYALPDLRWNNYLYFVVDRSRINDVAFNVINRTYAKETP